MYILHVVFCPDITTISTVCAASEYTYLAVSFMQDSVCQQYAQPV